MNSLKNLREIVKKEWLNAATLLAATIFAYDLISFKYPIMETRSRDNPLNPLFDISNYVICWMPMDKLGYITDLEKRVFNDSIQTLTHIDEKIHRLSNNPTFFDILSLSSEITRENIEYKTFDSGEDKSCLGYVLSKGFGDCTSFSEITYSNYAYIVRKLGRNDLLGDIRIADGFSLDNDGQHGHEWLEYRIKDRWFVFECTTITQDNAQNYMLTVQYKNNPNALDLILAHNRILYKRQRYWLCDSHNVIHASLNE